MSGGEETFLLQLCVDARAHVSWVEGCKEEEK
jgi:hypothetical protein